jgi:hypothetical protein
LAGDWKRPSGAVVLKRHLRKRTYPMPATLLKENYRSADDRCLLADKGNGNYVIEELITNKPGAKIPQKQ